MVASWPFVSVGRRKKKVHLQNPQSLMELGYYISKACENIPDETCNNDYQLVLL